MATYEQVLAQLQASVGNANRVAREASDAANQANAQRQQLSQIVTGLQTQLAQQKASSEALQNALSRLQIERTQGDPNIQRVENIPGKRIQFDCFVEIPLTPGSSEAAQQTYMIPQTGPFIAVARYAALFSYNAFQTLDQSGNVVATFQGRSFGRQRPIASVWDLNDGQLLDGNPAPVAQPGTGAPYIVGVPNASPFRSMEGDFRIQFMEQGTQFPRQNLPVPSALWNKGISDPSELAALDFFPRGAVLQFTVQPTHPLNPAYGNAFGFSGSYPFPESQWDAVEGIVDTAGQSTTDPVVRVPNATLVIGFMGYMIVQPAGAGAY